MRFILPILACIWLASPAAAVELQGRFVQGGMVMGATSKGAHVSLDGKAVRVSEDGLFVIGFDRDAAQTAMLVVTGVDGTVDERVLNVEKRAYKVERVDGVPPRTVNIPPEEQARRKRERAMVVSARKAESDAVFWNAPFIWPAVGRISGVYGSQRVLNGQPRWPHMGLDIAAPTGTPVKAPQAGTIVLAQKNFLLEGGLIILDHGHQVFSSFLHLSGVNVKAGDKVKQGDVIGSIGATGRATGPHLDWRMKWKNVNLDPALLLDEGGHRAAQK